MTPGAAPIVHDVVLVGGGHAHVQVLRRWAMRPPPGARLTVVVDRPDAVYSGMVPGFVAGQYRLDELRVDVRPLALRARARYVGVRAVGLDATRRQVWLDGRPPLAYDTVSLDIGGSVAGLDRPGVREHAVATRPIGRFVEAVDPLLARARARRAFRLVVVGAGAAGVELAFAFRARLAREGVAAAAVTLLEGGPRILPGFPPGAARRIEAAARAAGIALRCGAAVEAVHADHVALAGGDGLPADAVVWVVGAAPVPGFEARGLETDPRGFLRIRPTLQATARDDVFAVGDCASLGPAPGLPKAGVFAVRQGPVLARNLRARVRGGRMARYQPQRDFLALLNLGDGTALGAKWGRAARSRLLLELKDRIDRRFVRRFQVLGPDGAPAAAFARGPAMDPAAMPCGGCAAKVGESVLARALDRIGLVSDPAVVLGLAVPDDAAAVETERGEIVGATIDGFRAFTDDPYLVGRVSAVNAASDLWAKGVTPRFALAQVAVPEADAGRAEETLYQTLAGARAALDAEGITLVGGHTTTGPELAVGFAVLGFAPSADALVRIAGMAPGDRLVLTKALGTGVLFHADMRGLARGAWMEAAVAAMLRTNARASAVMRAVATAATDVSGFGLAGHLGEMARASKVGAVVDLDALPLLPGAAALLARGLRSTFHPENARARRALRVSPAADTRPELDIVFDPQTSGGLLLAVPAARAAETVAALHAAGDVAAVVIGEVTPPRPDGALFEIVATRPA